MPRIEEAIGVIFETAADDKFKIAQVSSRSFNGRAAHADQPRSQTNIQLAVVSNSHRFCNLIAFSGQACTHNPQP